MVLEMASVFMEFTVMSIFKLYVSIQIIKFINRKAALSCQTEGAAFVCLFGFSYLLFYLLIPLVDEHGQTGG